MTDLIDQTIYYGCPYDVTTFDTQQGDFCNQGQFVITICHELGLCSQGHKKFSWLVYSKYTLPKGLPGNLECFVE